MMTALARRLVQMSREEFSWRVRTQLRTHAEEAAAAVCPPRWSRADIGGALAVDTLPEELQHAVKREDWQGLHRGLWSLLRSRPARFVLDPSARAEVQHVVRARCPHAEADAVRRADAAADGMFDLLGHRSLSFGGGETHAIDWHLDPVHERRMPMTFWSRVPYLDPRCGDHKVVWELNRHQHWLTVSRALWLSGDQRHARHMLRDLAAWMDANPPLIGANWASMLELSFRSLSWLWGLHAMLAYDDAGEGEPWLVDLLLALNRQLTQVERNLSVYFSPNTHLTGEALALYVAGAALPELASSTRWIDTGRAVLLHEIDRQIEPDGGHVERSTHYHRYTLDFYLFAVLTARRLGDAEAESRFTGALERLVPFALAMADANGWLPRIGDDDGGRLWLIGPRDPADIRDSLGVAAIVADRPDWSPHGATEDVFWLTTSDPQSFERALAMDRGDLRMGERRTLPFRAVDRHGPRPSTSSVLPFPQADRRERASERRGHVSAPPAPAAAGPAPVENARVTRIFPDTGYVTSATPAGDHLIVSAGPHGYLNGGHAHADALSIVLSLRGRPLLIDPGTPTYTMDPGLRDHLRSSVNHNTVTVDGRSSAEPQGPFHWRTRADARLESVRQNARFSLVEARHDGYGDVGHRRVVLASDAGYLLFDLITGDGAHEAAQSWHFHPQWRVNCESNQALRLVHEHGDVAWLLSERGSTRLAFGDERSPAGWVSPGYGRQVPAWTARVAHSGDAPFAMVTWCGTSPHHEPPALARVDCQCDPGVPGVAVRLSTGGAECVALVRPGDTPERSGRSCSAGPFNTDGRTLQYTSEDGVLASVLVTDATYARVANGAFGLESDAVVMDLHVARAGDRVELTASMAPARIVLEGRIVEGASSVLLNGREAQLSPGTSMTITASDWGHADNRNVEEPRDVRDRRVR